MCLYLTSVPQLSQITDWTNSTLNAQLFKLHYYLCLRVYVILYIGIFFLELPEGTWGYPEDGIWYISGT